MREDPATQPLPVGGRAAEEVGTVDGPTRTLRRHPSAIDIVGRARHITCALGAEPDDHFGDLFGVAHALKRGVRKDRLAAQLHRGLSHAGPDVARADRVHPDVGLGIFDRRGLGQPDHAVLGRDIGG